MIFAVYKPRGISSYDVIRKLKMEYPRRTKIGHGGTLDPLAEGVLVVGVGRESTKKLQAVLKDSTKEYIAGIELGRTSETDDAEGPLHITEQLPPEPTKQDIAHVLQSFVGKIEQTPPKYSAIKIAGMAAYKRARLGEELHLQPKSVYIHALEILDYTYPVLEIRVECGSGVYIRSLARDIGTTLGTGAYLIKLVRTRVGEFTIEGNMEGTSKD